MDAKRKCVWEDNTCKKQSKLCSDYKIRDTDSSTIYEHLSAENSSYKRCSYNKDNDKWEEVQYLSN